MGEFRRRLAHDERICDVRGRGLMIGIELDRDVTRVRQQAFEAGLLLNVTQERVIRLLPPLIIDREQAGEIVETVCSLIAALD